MKKLFIGLILSPLVMFSAAPPPPATQAEVDAGLDSYKYVTPKTLGLTTLIGTNAGISAATGTNIANYAALIATNNLTTVKDPLVIDHALVDWFFDILSGGGNSLVVYQTGGSATPLFTFTDGGYFIPLNGFQGDGSLVTNVNGTNIQSLTISNAVIANNTINSNKLDAATRALLGAAASSGLLEVDSNGRLATTNLVDRYETNTLTVGQGPPANLNSAIHFVGGATPHIETFGASSWWDFNTPVTNADVVHFSSVVVMDPDNVVYGAGTLALPAATATSPALGDSDTSVATTEWVSGSITNRAEINAADFGAVVSTSTDSSSAIQAAINYATNLTTTTLAGATVYIPRGTYTLSNTITLYPGVTLKGAGRESTRLQFAGSLSNLIQYSTSGASASHYTDIVQVSVRDLWIDSKGTESFTGDAISLLGTSTLFIAPVLQSVQVTAYARHGININEAIGGELDNCFIQNASSNGVYIPDSGRSMTFRNTYSRLNGSYGWNVKLGYSTFTGCSADTNGTVGIGGGGWFLNQCTGVSIIGSDVEYNHGSGVYIYKGFNNVVQGVLVLQAGTTTNGITLSNAIGAHLIANTFTPKSNLAATNTGYAVYSIGSSYGCVADNYYAANFGGGAGVNDTALFSRYVDSQKLYLQGESGTQLSFVNGTLTAGTFAGAGGGLTLDASGFNGNLTTGDNTLQEVAQKLDDLSTGAGTTLWYTNPVAASSISNAYHTKINGNLDVTGTNTSGTANITNMYLVGRASALALIESDGQLDTNSVGTAVPINADGTATTFAQIQTLAPSVIQTNGASTSYSNNVSVTAPAYYSPTNANNTGAYTAGLSYFTNLTGNITLAPFASIPSGSWSITIAAKADGTTRSITFPNGTVNNAVNTAPAVAYVTNGTTLVLQVVGYGSSFTNVLTPH